MLVALALGAAGVGSASATSLPNGLHERLAEVAALYGDRGASTAAIVEARPEQAGRLLGASLGSRRGAVVVFVLRARARPGVFLPVLGDRPGPRDTVVAGAIDRRSGAVIAARLLARAPGLRALGAPRLVRLAAFGPEPPAVIGTAFDAALTRLRDAGLRVSVPAFPRLPAFRSNGGLDDYVVTAALPLGRRTVRLELLVRARPIGSIVVPVAPPVTVPDFVGKTYRAAIAGVPGLYLRIGRVGALRPASSWRGLDAFVVSAQQPAPGTVVPAYGQRIPNGIDIGPSTVTLTLAVRGAGR